MLSLKGFSTSDWGIHLNITVPNPVTDSSHARMLRTLLKYVPYEEDPREIAGRYLALLDAAKPEGLLSYILSVTLTRFPKASFIRFGDKNRVKEVNGRWFNDKGIAIDVQAEVIAEVNSLVVLPQDIVEHVMKHRPGQFTNPYKEEIAGLVNLFYGVYGVRLTPAYAKWLCSIQPETLPF
jgi:hypothetical protein